MVHDGLASLTDACGDPFPGIEILKEGNDPMMIRGGLPGIQVIPMGVIRSTASKISMLCHHLVTLQFGGDFGGVVVFGIVTGSDKYHWPGGINVGNIEPLGEALSIGIAVIHRLLDHHFEDAVKVGFTLKYPYFAYIVSAQKIIQFDACPGLKKDKAYQHPKKEEFLHMHTNCNFLTLM